jgi:hypothetical protein
MAEAGIASMRPVARNYTMPNLHQQNHQLVRGGTRRYTRAPSRVRSFRVRSFRSQFAWYATVRDGTRRHAVHSGTRGESWYAGGELVRGGRVGTRGESWYAGGVLVRGGSVGTRGECWYAKGVLVHPGGFKHIVSAQTRSTTNPLLFGFDNIGSCTAMILL